MTATAEPRDLMSSATDKRVDPFVQQWIAGTNGNLYIPLVNKLSRYPIPAWPAEGESGNNRRLLDIGCGWGRWMLAGARAGYRPVGIDIKLEAVQAARRVMKAHGVSGHVVVADLGALPFKESAFSCVLSYSVVQHAHKRKATACINEAKRVLNEGGTCLIELPLKFGLTNIRHLVKSQQAQDDAESWSVRYYTWQELKDLFGGVFGNVRISTDCFCGIGVRREDLDILPWKYKPIVIASNCLRTVAQVIYPFTRVSDSVFVLARKDAICSS
jgi:SAM-dependent methyltransferase